MGPGQARHPESHGGGGDRRRRSQGGFGRRCCRSGVARSPRSCLAIATGSAARTARRCCWGEAAPCSGLRSPFLLVNRPVSSFTEMSFTSQACRRAGRGGRSGQADGSARLQRPPRIRLLAALHHPPLTLLQMVTSASTLQARQPRTASARSLREAILSRSGLPVGALGCWVTRQGARGGQRSLARAVLRARLPAVTFQPAHRRPSQPPADHIGQLSVRRIRNAGRRGAGGAAGAAAGNQPVRLRRLASMGQQLPNSMHANIMDT